MSECDNCKSENERREREEIEYEKRMKGYRYWCDTCCKFVDRNHRCEQWAHITYVSPQLYGAICHEEKT